MMETNQIKQLVICLLSNSRRADRPQICQSLTKMQICDLIEETLPPNQDNLTTDRMIDRVGEQLEILLHEFEIITTGDTRLRYCMAPPSLILISEEPLLAQYVGDRAYMERVRVLLGNGNNTNGNLIGSSSRLSEAREALEQVGISVQTEEMLFQAVPDPALPTEIALSMAEQIPLEEVTGSVEVYIPRRADPLESRWSRLDQAAPSAQSELYRARTNSTNSKANGWIYLWKQQNTYFRLTVQQAFLAMYKIDIETNAPRLLDLDKAIPLDVIWQIPRDYARLVRRYTEESDGQPRYGFDGNYNDSKNQQIRIRPKYKSLITALLENKLGMNRSML